MSPDLNPIRATLALELIGQLQECAQQSGTIIVGEIHQASLLH